MIVAGRTVLDRYEPVKGRDRITHVWRCYADIITFKSEPLANPRAGSESPMFDVVVPAVGGLAQIVCRPLPSIAFDHVGRGEKPGNLDREREGRVARVFLPAVLSRHRAVAHEVARRPLNHWDETI